MKTWHKILILIVLVIVAASVIFFWLRGDGPTDSVGNDGNNPFPDLSSDGDIQNPIDFDSSSGEQVFDGPLSPSDPSGILFDFPVKAFRILPDMTEYGERVYAVEQSVGHVYGTTVIGAGTEVLANTTIPRIQESSISSDGRHVVVQYLSEGDNSDEMETFLATLVEVEATENATSTDEDLDNAPYTLEGEFLPDEVLTYTFSPDGSELFYLLDRNTFSEGRLRSLVDGTEQTLFTTPLRELDAQWQEGSDLYLITRPSAHAKGYVFDVVGQSLRKVYEGENGLIFNPSPSGALFLLSETTLSGNVELSVWDTIAREKSILDIVTLASKCVWHEESRLFCAVPRSIPSRDLPDAWYRGDVAFSDVIVEYNIATGSTRIAFDPRDEGFSEFDATDLQLNSGGFFLLFEDKISGALFTVRL